MPSERNKYWSSPVVVLALMLVTAFITVSCKQQDNITSSQANKNSMQKGPIIDPVLRDTAGQIGKLPDNPEELSSLGDSYLEGRRYALAIKAYKKALELRPNDIDTVNDLGLAFHYAGRSADAVDTLKRGAGIQPSFQRIWLSLGYVLMSAGREDEAKTALAKAVELDPDNDVGQEAKRMIGLTR